MFILSWAVMFPNKSLHEVFTNKYPLGGIVNRKLICFFCKPIQNLLLISRGESMKRNIEIIAILLMLTNLANAQGPNRTFGKFKKQNGGTELTCSGNCATIILIYEKGTYINGLIKAAIGIDDKYALASDIKYYVEINIPAGVHKISLPQGINQGEVTHEVQECELSDTAFIGLCSMFSNKGNYTIRIGSDITDLEYNLSNVPYTTEMFAYEINYLTYKRNFEAGKTYYYKSLKLPNDINSLSCGPLISETTQEDFETIIQGKNIKGKEKGIIYINPEKKL